MNKANKQGAITIEKMVVSAAIITLTGVIALSLTSTSKDVSTTANSEISTKSKEVSELSVRESENKWDGTGKLIGDVKLTAISHPTASSGFNYEIGPNDSHAFKFLGIDKETEKNGYFGLVGTFTNPEDEKNFKIELGLVERNHSHVQMLRNGMEKLFLAKGCDDCGITIAFRVKNKTTNEIIIESPLIFSA